jgi:uncharacterized membrane protein
MKRYRLSILVAMALMSVAAFAQSAPAGVDYAAALGTSKTSLVEILGQITPGILAIVVVMLGIKLAMKFLKRAGS